jgi:hypothetical protein
MESQFLNEELFEGVGSFLKSFFVEQSGCRGGKKEGVEPKGAAQGSKGHHANPGGDMSAILH